MRRACVAAQEKLNQILEVHPDGISIDSQLEVERDELAQIERASPPDELRSPHTDIVTAYKQRITKLEALSKEIKAGNKDKSELQAIRDEADSFADQMNKMFAAIGVKECEF